MKKKLFYAVIFLCLPLVILTVALIRRGSTYQGKSALVWFENIKMAQQSPNLDALKAMGESAVPTLQRELKNTRIGHRIKAAWVLGQLGTSAHIAVPDLIQSMDDTDMVVRSYAIRGNVPAIVEKRLVERFITRLWRG